MQLKSFALAFLFYSLVGMCLMKLFRTIEKFQDLLLLNLSRTSFKLNITAVAKALQINNASYILCFTFLLVFCVTVSWSILIWGSYFSKIFWRKYCSKCQIFLIAEVSFFKWKEQMTIMRFHKWSRLRWKIWKVLEVLERHHTNNTQDVVHINGTKEAT